MKRYLTATAAVTALTLGATAATAGNLAEPVMEAAPAPMPAPMVMTNDWTGFYAGGSLGYATADEASDAFDESGSTYGLHAGYDYDFGSFVMGGELEISGFDLEDGGNEVDSVSRAKIRAGYDAGSFMPYVAAGVARLDIGGLDADDTGSFYGLGVDYMYSDSIRVGGEVLKHEFDDFNDTGLDFDATTAAVRVSFQF